MSKKSPKLRTVNKSIPAFELNEFPKEFPYLLGKEIVYLLATKGKPKLEGDEWESIFANCIGATWKSSNVGLDDVILGNTAWGAKTVKSSNPSKQKKVRLISGRNSPVYSFGEVIDVNADPNLIGKHILDIWNERVSSIREKYKHVRTIVLVKANDLSQVLVFEFETIRYDPELFTWKLNKNGNLEGYDNRDNEHRFTWQPHGSQFTIIEDIPEDVIIIYIKKQKFLDKEQTLKALGFNKSWITVIKKNG
jgi:hypothetical protein